MIRSVIYFFEDYNHYMFNTIVEKYYPGKPIFDYTEAESPIGIGKYLFFKIRRKLCLKAK